MAPRHDLINSEANSMPIFSQSRPSVTFPSPQEHKSMEPKPPSASEAKSSGSDDKVTTFEKVTAAKSTGGDKSEEAHATMSLVAEAKLDLEVEHEWKQRQTDTSPHIEISRDPKLRRICAGLVINHMNMRCADSGRLLWQTDEWSDDVYEKEQEAHIPADILKCTAVSRELNFTSKEEIHNFRLEQRVFLQGSCIEEWLFTFGYVIPGSTNTWQQTIEAASPDQMLDPELISGIITMETAFYDGDHLIAKTVYRIFYE